MSDHETSTPEPQTSEEALTRRNVVQTLLGVLGTGVLAGCARGADGSIALSDGTKVPEDEIEGLAQGLTGTTIRWADTVLGVKPPTARTGDLAKNNSSALGNAVLVIAKGCVAIGDGGGGIFYWQAGVTTGDDGGTIIVPSPSPTGRWCRVYSGALDVKWFGARGDWKSESPPPTSDDTQAIKNAIAAAVMQRQRVTAGQGFFGFIPPIHFPPGQYRVREAGALNPIGCGSSAAG